MRPSPRYTVLDLRCAATGVAFVVLAALSTLASAAALPLLSYLLLLLAAVAGADLVVVALQRTRATAGQS